MKTLRTILVFFSLANATFLGGCTTTWDQTFRVDARGIAAAEPGEDARQVRDRALEIVRTFAISEGFTECVEYEDALRRHAMFQKEHHGEWLLVWLQTEQRIEIHSKDEGLVAQVDAITEFRQEVDAVRIRVTGEGDESIRNEIRRLAAELQVALVAAFGEASVAVPERISAE